MLLHVPSAFVFDAEFAHLLFPRSTAVGRLTVTEWVTKRVFTQVGAWGGIAGNQRDLVGLPQLQGVTKRAFTQWVLLGELRETIVLGKKNKILRNFLKKKTFQKKIVYLRKFLKDHAF